jgi:hypothetical protein
MIMKKWEITLIFSHFETLLFSSRSVYTALQALLIPVALSIKANGLSHPDDALRRKIHAHDLRVL